MGTIWSIDMAASMFHEDGWKTGRHLPWCPCSICSVGKLNEGRETQKAAFLHPHHQRPSKRRSRFLTTMRMPHTLKTSMKKRPSIFGSQQQHPNALMKPAAHMMCIGILVGEKEPGNGKDSHSHPHTQGANPFSSTVTIQYTPLNPYKGKLNWRRGR